LPCLGPQLGSHLALHPSRSLLVPALSPPEDPPLLSPQLGPACPHGQGSCCHPMSPSALTVAKGVAIPRCPQWPSPVAHGDRPQRSPMPHRQPSEYIKAILELSTLVVRRHHHPLHLSSWLYRLSADGRRFAQACATVHSFTANVVQCRRQALDRLGHQAWLESHQGRRMDFIDLLLLSKVPLG